MLTKYGTDNIIAMLAIGVVLIILGFALDKAYLSPILYALGGLLIAFTFWFFRDPDRKIPEEALKNNKIVLSPADGRVVEIVREKENEYMKSEAVRISVFLSPLDIHVNRIPISGVVEYFKYYKGSFHIASAEKASLENEQNHIGLKTETGEKIFFKQIVGILARRLVWDIKVGDTVKTGRRFGMMKFGSRMDVFVPKDSKIFVKVGDRTIAGITKFAELP